MRPETEARIRNVKKFAKNGWQFCAFAGFMLGIYLLGAWVTIVFRFAGTRLNVGTFYSVNADLLTAPSSRIWSFVVVTVVAGLSAWMLLHLYRLFKHLEAGSIYTQQNVHHLRQVGWLSMALAVIQLLLPLLAFVLAELNLVDATLVPRTETANGAPIWLGQSLSGVITASLILLASWIMDVGRQISDDADAMRREADLVI
ncbi:MAG TPA: DUF2975 domain-containing protein [Gammaproteobacteria bacterium]|nr:DUF2975 domain-containing protein [Gammaproteobacteria bacterium]